MSMRWSEEWARFKLPGRCNPSQTILNNILPELDDGFTGNLLGHHTSIIFFFWYVGVKNMVKATKSQRFQARRC
jgi:hypothetical protein